jgi:uncharacterized protein (DUF427 family)
MTRPTVRAIWNGIVLAESDATVVVEGNHYFPLDSVASDYLSSSTTTSTCHWKGTATYFSAAAQGRGEPDVAWAYLDPRPQADGLRGRVAFWKGVRVEVDGT